MEQDATHLDIAIVGAGAAGLMAGIFAGRTLRAADARGGQADQSSPSRVAALDGATRLGAKILVAGGGRCNVTHHQVAPADFNTPDARALPWVLRSFGVDDTVAFFDELGVVLKREETGKLFPTTDDAHTVLDALVAAARSAGCQPIPACRVRGISRRADGGFDLDNSGGASGWSPGPPSGRPTESAGTLRAGRVILATGGKSLPKTGSDGLGYSLAQSLGHTIRPTFPALVPLLLPGDHWLTRLSGLSAEVSLSLATPSGKVIRRERGAMLLTHFGLSGPAVLDMSRHFIAAGGVGRVSLSASLLPDMDFAAAERWLLERATAAPRGTASSLLRGSLPQRLADALVRHGAAIAADMPVSQLTRDARRALARAITELPLPVIGDRGFAHAEVTAGGVPLSEIDPRTMASRVCPGLYLCGEILDVDGRIGGFNFQWAWASGRLAGIGAARSLDPMLR